jgi:cyclic pyranopterin phosphate synthase
MSMVDGQGRQITYLRISLTDRCNLRCVYCMPEEGLQWMPSGEILTDDEVVRIVALALRRGLKKVRFSGGEPLVRHGLASLVARVCALPGLEDVSITTNGVFLAAQARRLYDAGLRRINVSLDSLQPENFARIVRRDLFDQVWEGIEDAERVGFDPIKINVVLQAGVNDHEVSDFVRLTFRKPYHVRFIEQMPCANWEAWVRAYRPSAPVLAQIAAEFGAPIPLPVRNHAGPAELYRLQGALGVIGFIHAVSHDFCDRCNRMRLTADGKIRPCLFSEITVDLLPALRNGASDATLNALLDQALRIKPEYHELDRMPREKALLTMVNIGG